MDVLSQVLRPGMLGASGRWVLWLRLCMLQSMLSVVTVFDNFIYYFLAVRVLRCCKGFPPMRRAGALVWHGLSSLGLSQRSTGTVSRAGGLHHCSSWPQPSWLPARAQAP